MSMLFQEGRIKKKHQLGDVFNNQKKQSYLSHWNVIEMFVTKSALRNLEESIFQVILSHSKSNCSEFAIFGRKQ